MGDRSDPGAPRPSRGGSLAILVLLAGLLGGPFLLRALKPRGPEFCSDCRWPVNPPHTRAEEQPRKPFTVKALMVAQADFRANERAGGGIRGYWRGDVAGLHTLPGKDGRPIALIEIRGALADDRPLAGLPSLGERRPCGGAWFRAIRHEGEEDPDPDRFALCQFPAEYPHHGRMTFIVDEGNTIFKKDLGHGRGVEVYPADPAREGWTPLD